MAIFVQHYQPQLQHEKTHTYVKVGSTKYAAGGGGDFWYLGIRLFEEYKQFIIKAIASVTVFGNYQLTPLHITPGQLNACKSLQVSV